MTPRRRPPAAVRLRARRWVLRLAPLPLLVVAGCGNEDTPSALDPRGEEASQANVLWWILLGAATVVGIVVIALILWGALRPPRDNPGRMGDDSFIALGGVALPALVLVPVAVLTVVFTAMMRPAGTSDDALQIDVIAHQYWWEVRYPDHGIETANELTIPVDREVELRLRSADVIHSFWVPQLAGKQDLVPGQTNGLTIEASETGRYLGKCAEFCGVQHTNMDLVVNATSDEEFDTWVDDHDPVSPGDPLARRGRQVFNSVGCAGCHTVAGNEPAGDEGPDLTDVGTRTLLAGGVLDNTPENLARVITDMQSVKAGAEMLPFDLTDEEIEALVAYLRGDR